MAIIECPHDFTEHVPETLCDEHGNITTVFVKKPTSFIDPSLDSATFSLTNSVANNFNLDPVSMHVSQSLETQTEIIKQFADEYDKNKELDKPTQKPE